MKLSKMEDLGGEAEVVMPTVVDNPPSQGHVYTVLVEVVVTTTLPPSGQAVQESALAPVVNVAAISAIRSSALILPCIDYGSFRQWHDHWPQEKLLERLKERLRLVEQKE
jgi:hypothetical protein